MTTVEAFAPAKVNLTLHVTGHRADGYHLLDSLVAFADVGDRLIFRTSESLSLDVNGPLSKGVPGDENNLVLKAAQWLNPRGTAAIMLEKHLPSEAGIGGGSADAAATLRGLSKLWDMPIPDNTAELGADVPVCLRPGAKRMSGIGEVLNDIPPLPPVWAVLANPGVSSPTPDVFGALLAKDNAPMPENIPAFKDAAELADWLAGQRNDLETPALALTPAIGLALEALRGLEGCLLSRMSGSGATCFGLFASEDGARAGAALLPPAWWTAATRLS